MESSLIDQTNIHTNGAVDKYVDQVKKLAGANSQTIVEYRRHLHANPELSFREHQTAAYIKVQLDTMGITWEAVAETGVVAIIKGEKPGEKVIGLRADIDALPILEKNEVDYASHNQGVMHACGHDVHTSSLLGAAYILQQMKKDFGGIVKLVFQPAEEQLPGGAILMIKAGVLKDPAPSAMIGQHVMPFLETGKIGVRAGKHMASMDEIYVTVSGRGGHSAQPHRNVDPVLISAQIITALQQIVSRQSDPTIPSVLSFGKVIANGSVNVTPDEVYMEGTFRTMDEKWRQDAHEKMIKVATGIAESLDGKCRFEIKKGYPFLINEEKLTQQLSGFMQDYMGRENVVPVDMWMASEDFAYYSQAVSSCFYLLGVGNTSKGITASLHSAYFNVDEKSLEIERKITMRVVKHSGDVDYFIGDAAAAYPPEVGVQVFKRHMVFLKSSSTLVILDEIQLDKPGTATLSFHPEVAAESLDANTLVSRDSLATLYFKALSTGVRIDNLASDTLIATGGKPFFLPVIKLNYDNSSTVRSAVAMQWGGNKTIDYKQANDSYRFNIEGTGELVLDIKKQTVQWVANSTASADSIPKPVVPVYTKLKPLYIPTTLVAASISRMAPVSG